MSTKFLTLLSSGCFFACGILVGLEHQETPAAAAGPPAVTAQQPIECTGQSCPAPTAAPKITVTPGPGGSWADLSIDVIADSDQLLELDKDVDEAAEALDYPGSITDHESPITPSYDGPITGDVNWGIDEITREDLDRAALTPPAIDFVSEYDAWSQTDRWLWVHVTGEGCTWCEREAALFTDPRVVAASQHLACCELDVADPRAAAYRVRGVPTDFLIELDRETMHRFEGAPASAEELVERLGHSIVEERRAAAPLPAQTPYRAAARKTGPRPPCGASSDPR